MNKYLLINNFLDNDIINYYLKISNNYTKQDSKVGTRIDPNQKKRIDIYFTKTDSKILDNIIFNTNNIKKLKNIFNINIRYRENYKLGLYYGENKGFYNPHTDTQGGMKHRKISFVVCLSDINDYEGGIFKFINLGIDLKFKKGDAIFFDSNLFHGVEPVLEGVRKVMISFMWDINGENIRDKDNTINYTPFLEKYINTTKLNKKNYSFLDNITYDNKIISFSLWGISEIFNYGIVENILIIKKYLPDFVVYVYYNNTILNKIIRILKDLDNTKLILINNNILEASNMLWRFKPCFNSNSIIFIRDADSLINLRDINAIKEFIISDFKIHSIKDSIHHIKYNILGGMWGCKDGILNTDYYRNLYNNYKYLDNVRGIDQELLTQIYSIEKNNILTHTTRLLKNKINEENIIFIETAGNHIGSFNYYAPLTRNLLKEPNDKLSSKRYYNFSSKNKYISCIPPDSGPGNQVVSIKECLILANILNRICIIPPIREHYIKNNKIFYNFNEIFYLKNISNKIEDKNNMLIENTQNVYTIHNKYFKKKLRHEQLITGKYNEKLLNKKKIVSNNDMEELQNISDKILVIKHLFNNVYINECGVNGCFSDKINPHFEIIYKNICSKFDFSDNIKNFGNRFINNKLEDLFIAIHIRLPDIMNKPLNEFTNNIYDNNILREKIKSIYNNKYIFIASNNIEFIKNLNLNLNYVYFEHNIEYSSFIDQYICSQSEIFYYLNLENTRFGNIHNRSTFTSFIIDYRNHLLNIPNNKNINLN